MTKWTELKNWINEAIGLPKNKSENIRMLEKYKVNHILVVNPEKKETVSEK